MFHLNLDDGFGKIVESLKEDASKSFDKDWFAIVGIAETFLDVQNNINNGFVLKEDMNPATINLLIRGLIESIYNLQDALLELSILIKNKKASTLIKEFPLSQNKDVSDDLSLRSLRNATVGHPLGANKIENGNILLGFILTGMHGLIPDSEGITFRYYRFGVKENKQKGSYEVYITYARIQEYFDKIEQIGKECLYPSKS